MKTLVTLYRASDYLRKAFSWRKGPQIAVGVISYPYPLTVPEMLTTAWPWKFWERDHDWGRVATRPDPTRPDLGNLSFFQTLCYLLPWNNLSMGQKPK